MPKLKPNHVSPSLAKIDLTEEQFNEIVASEMTFAEIESRYGEEVAINAGIARNPDTWELTDEDFARMCPAIELVPDLGGVVKVRV
jgi:hypothetical protein